MVIGWSSARLSAEVETISNAAAARQSVFMGIGNWKPVNSDTGRGAQDRHTPRPTARLSASCALARFRAGRPSSHVARSRLHAAANDRPNSERENEHAG